MVQVSPSARVRARKKMIAAVSERAVFAREQRGAAPEEEAGPSAEALGKVAPAGGEVDEAPAG